MYDIVIQKNGGLYLADGDLQEASYERFIAQKLHAAVMEIPPDLLGGRSSAGIQVMQKVLQQYFADRFIHDIDIDPKKISCIINDATFSNYSATYILTYSGISPSGKPVNYSSDFTFQLESGALIGNSYEIKFPNINLGGAYEVEEFITLTSMTQEIELPVTPMLGNDFNNLQSPIMLIPANLSGSINEIEMNYSILTDGKRKTYQIENYTVGFDINIHVLKSLTSMYTIPETMNCTIYDKYGKHIVRTSEEGQIVGMASVVVAKYLTYDILYLDTYLNRNVFRLKPTSGKCIARFPGTVAPGEYILKYTGVQQP